MTPDPATHSWFSARRPVTHSTVRLIANVEATSFLLLLVCMILKYAGPKIRGPVLAMGWIHGLLFLAFIWVIVRARLTLGWTKKRTWLAAGSSVIPLAPYFVAHSESADTTPS
jgi:integral membrane protein